MKRSLQTKNPATPGEPPRSPGVAGFTITEISAVLLISAVLAAVAAPRFFGRSGFDERFFTDDTLSALRYAQKLSVATGCEVQVTLAADTYTLNLQDGCSGSSYTTAVYHPGTGTSGYSNTAPGGVSMSTTESPLIFDPLGRIKDSLGNVTNATITIAGRTIEAVGETGFVYAP